MDRHDFQDRITVLRQQFKTHGINGFIVPVNDEFQGEYIPEHAKRLRWLTGFSGSAGLGIVLEDRAAFFTDGRYVLQAAQEVDQALYEIHNTAEMLPEVWLEKHAASGAAIGFDPWLHTANWCERYKKKLGPKQITLTPVPNLIDRIWKDRPLPTNIPAQIHAMQFAGETAELKRTRIAAVLLEKGAETAVITAPDSICWLLNIRGGDVPHTPFLLSYAVIDTQGTVKLFADPQKISEEMKEPLSSAVSVHPLSSFANALEQLKGKKVLADPENAGFAVFEILQKAGAVIIRDQDPCQLPKACKNPVELEGMRQAHIRDGAAVVKFLSWLDMQLENHITELDVVNKLHEFRGQNELFRDLSFATIAGFGPNGAIVHYRVTEETNRIIKPGSLLLIDSGGQYDDGTTDITRTVAIGEPSLKMREHFTRVLKGHIAIAMAKFPEGTTGSQLDSLARYHLWQAGLDYDHGTGHGVGSYLSVHEGPQRIARRGGDVALKPGMVLSNEPGFYLAGEYGIRIESLVAVRECEELSKQGKRFFEFETLTQVPIDRRLVDVSLLTDAELGWLNRYHQRVYESLIPLIGKTAENWLRQAAATIDRT